MKITNEFTVHTPIDQAWKLLTDLEAIAPCMPGAALTGVEDDTYKGKVKIKVGPVISEFAGTARFLEKSDTDYRASIDAKGRDARSAGNASAVVTAVLRPAGDSTTVSVDTDLKISGKLAQFGSGMIKEVSTKLLTQFVANLEAKLAAETVAAPAPDPAAPEAASDGAAPSAAAVETVPGTGASPAPVNGSAAASSVRTPAASPAPMASVASSGAPASNDSSVATASNDSSVATASNDSSGATASNGSSGATANAPSSARPVASSGPVASPASAATPSASAAPAARYSGLNAEEPEPIDLLSVAGRSIYKRLIPVGVVVVVVAAVIAWLIGRR
jgi:carbon monoxide dehydrogenase subunit G